MSADENAPDDMTTLQAEEIIRAAIDWRSDKGPDPLLSRAEWRLYEATSRYGDKFKGVKGR